MPWLGEQFGWSIATAERFMRAAEAFGQFVTVTNLEIDAGALYLLAGPSVPPAVRAEAVERAEAGERITKAEAQRLIDRAFAHPEPAKLKRGSFATKDRGSMFPDETLPTAPGRKAPATLFAAKDVSAGSLSKAREGEAGWFLPRGGSVRTST